MKTTELTVRWDRITGAVRWAITRTLAATALALGLALAVQTVGGLFR